MKDNFEKNIIKNNLLFPFKKGVENIIEEKNKNFNINKEILLNIIDKKINLNYNPKFINLINIPSNQGLFIDVKQDTEITPENLAEFAYPIVQFIEQTRPDYIIACDRGGRMLGLAVHLLYQQLYGALPTKDHSVRFRRISKSVPEQETAEYLRPDVETMAHETPNPKVLILDDWVVSGGTKGIAEKIFDKFSNGKAQVYFGVMRGPGADISGNAGSYALPGWKDDPSIIGVDYVKTVSRRIKSTQAIRYRQRIADGIKVFAHNLYQTPEVVTR